MKVRQINCKPDEVTEAARLHLEKNAPMREANITKICEDAIQAKAKKFGWKGA